MNILAIDTSSLAASCAYMEDGKLLGEYFTNAGLTHSQTVLPMLEDLFKAVRRSIDEVDVIAVTTGPGSFTGLRIGLATAKGLAFDKDIKCAGISTLEALAYNLTAFKGLIVPVMDARRGEVYTAAYISDTNVITEQMPPSTLEITNLGEYLSSCAGRHDIMLVGDGAKMCFERLSQQIPAIKIAPENMRHQRASSIILSLLSKTQEQLDSAGLEPIYLRLSQAEREYREKHNN